MKAFLGTVCAVLIVIAVHYYIAGDASRAAFFAILATFTRADYDRAK